MAVAERAVVVVVVAERGRLHVLVLHLAMAVAGEKAEAPPERKARRASADRDRAFIFMWDNQWEGVGGRRQSRGNLNVLTSYVLRPTFLLLSMIFYGAKVRVAKVKSESLQTEK